MEIISFSKLNLQRCENKDGFNLADEPLSYFALAMAEEVGEVCGVLKKIKRGFNDREKLKLIKALEEGMGENEVFEPPSDFVLKTIWHDRMLKKLGAEVADVFTYLDLFASKAQIDWKHEIIKKFNQVNTEMNFPTRYMINEDSRIII